MPIPPRKHSKQTDLRRRKTDRKWISSNSQRVSGHVVATCRFEYNLSVILFRWFCILRQNLVYIRRSDILSFLTMYGIQRSTEGELRYGHLIKSNSAFVFAHSPLTRNLVMHLKFHLLSILIFTINSLIKGLVL